MNTYQIKTFDLGCNMLFVIDKRKIYLLLINLPGLHLKEFDICFESN